MSRGSFQQLGFQHGPQNLPQQGQNLYSQQFPPNSYTPQTGFPQNPQFNPIPNQNVVCNPKNPKFQQRSSTQNSSLTQRSSRNSEQLIKMAEFHKANTVCNPYLQSFKGNSQPNSTK